jgi:hypothetical protein
VPQDFSDYGDVWFSTTGVSLFMYRNWDVLNTVRLMLIPLLTIGVINFAKESEKKAETEYIIALSGYAQSEDIERSKEAGFNQHLARPVVVGKSKGCAGGNSLIHFIQVGV